MRCGYFEDENREYVIDNPKTPIKWVNYLGTLEFGGLVDHTGGLLLCKGDPALNRITKYIPQLPSSQFKGHTLYLRFVDPSQPSGYKVFSPFFVPTLDPYEHFRSRVGLGYQRIESKMHGLESDVRLFIPQGASVCLMQVRVRNTRPDPVKLDACPVVEYTHFDALKQFTNADWVPQTMQSRVKEAQGVKLLTQYAFMKREMAVNFLASDKPFSSFSSDRAVFLGDYEYGDFKQPLALMNAELGNEEAERGDNIGALLLPLGTLKPGEEAVFTVHLGQAKDAEAAAGLVKKYSGADKVDAAFATLKEDWSAYLSRLQVETPDPALNSMLNVFNPRQCHTTKNWSRDLSLYQLGFGGRGIGFRDSSQDLMAVYGHMPEEGKGLLRKLISVQKRDGSAMHQFYASTGEANEGDAREGENRPRFYGDDHLWSVLTVTAYIRETGDFAFLDETLPFYDRGADGKPVESGTVREHLERALAFTKANVGKHGLPLLGFADWNDTVNLPKGAESLFNANLYGRALRDFAALLRHLGQKNPAENQKAAAYDADWEAMRAQVQEHAWDGKWWVRWFTAEGEAIGSHKNEKGRIWTNGQSWPVLSGFAEGERAATALDSVQELLNTEFGIKLSTPGYDGFDPQKGGVTTYPPGAKENGGIFLHANPWVIIAECLLGRGDRAYQYYQQINPAVRNDQIERYECEPYVYPQNVLGDEHPKFGLARNSWLSGTASWMYQAATQYILGLRPDYAGLAVDPCIPRLWDGYKATRVFRGATYEVEVRNPGHVNRGVKRLTLDGKEVAGNVLPLLPAGAVGKVVAELG